MWIVLFKKLKCLMCIVLALAMLPLNGCAVFRSETVTIGVEEAAPYLALTEQFLAALFEQDYSGCMAMFAENLTNTMDKAELQEEWETLRLSYGDAVTMDRYEAYRINGEGTILAYVTHTHGGSTVQLTFDADNGVAGLWFGMREDAPDYAVAVPEGVEEREILLGEGTQYELRAILTYPAGEETSAHPAVVLVHDSGAYDRNESIGGCTPFADLAHGLARAGIASIRYDKRTYTYGYDFTEDEVQSMTVQQEVIDDALLAIDALRAQPFADAERICIAGHGLGGMLAPRIAVQSEGKIAGIVSLAGSARGYLDVVYDQNLAMTDDASRLNAIKKEYKKVEKLDSQKDSATVFGIPVPYLKDLYAHPVGESLGQLSVPILILHGESDFQMSLSDYKSWQSALEDYAGEADFELFGGLNHLFAESASLKRRGTTAEYLAQSPVAQQVIDRIADWINEAK